MEKGQYFAIEAEQTNLMDFSKLQRHLRQFASDRDWEQFHSPKNLCMALSVEAAELLEHFQWLTEAESASLELEKCEEVAAEIADIQIYLAMLADELGIDIDTAVSAKIKSNAIKYPAAGASSIQD